MCNINAYLIQEKIKQMEYVTVPWIQLEYRLDYRGARGFLDILQKRGWVDPLPEGIKYPVIPINLQLRKISREEVDGLIEDITDDCVEVLTRIQVNAPNGTPYSDIEMTVRDEDDTQTALRILNDHKLIYFVNDLYFAIVSNKTIDILSDVANEKRISQISRKRAQQNPEQNRLQKLFDSLFEDE